MNCKTNEPGFPDSKVSSLILALIVALGVGAVEAQTDGQLYAVACAYEQAEHRDWMVRCEKWRQSGLPDATRVSET
jgi:hypothetical protein